MCKIKILLLSFVLFTARLSLAEEVWIPEEKNHFESDLVVEMNYLRMNGEEFDLRINKVLKGKEVGFQNLKEEDVPIVVHETFTEKEPSPCSVLPTPAKPPFAVADEFSKFLMANENPLADVGIEGVVLIDCIIDTSGMIIDLKVFKEVHPTLDSLAILKISSMPKWEPAKDANGKEVRCFEILPVLFRLKQND